MLALEINHLLFWYSALKIIDYLLKKYNISVKNTMYMCIFILLVSGSYIKNNS